MTINQKMVVSVNYRLTVSQADSVEELVEETTPEKPFVFLYGSGGLLEEFEKNLFGLKSGDLFDFVIKSEDGYGLSSEDNIVRIPIQAFRPEGEKLDTDMIRPGNFVPMIDDQGNQLQGLILQVNSEDILMDFNHPLAGKDLHFSGSVKNIRPASPEEISHGHVHGEGGHHH